MPSETEYQLVQYIEAVDSNNNNFAPMSEPTTDLRKLIAEGLINSKDSVTMIMMRSASGGDWRRWYIFYQGREIHI